MEPSIPRTAIRTAGTDDPGIAEQAGLPRVDKAWWEVEVDGDDPELDIREVVERLW